MSQFIFPVMGGDGNACSSSIILPWSTSPFPMGASQASVALTLGAGFMWDGDANHPIYFDSAYGKFRWTSTQSGGSVNVGAQICLGVPLHKDGNNATLYALMKVNNTSRLSKVQLLINDGSNNQYGNVLGQLSNDTWAEVYWATTASMSSWVDPLRFSLTIRGTDNSNNVGITEVYVQHLCVKFT